MRAHLVNALWAGVGAVAAAALVFFVGLPAATARGEERLSRYQERVEEMRESLGDLKSDLRFIREAVIELQVNVAKIEGRLP